MALIGAIVTANGFSVVSLIVLICGGMIILDSNSTIKSEQAMSSSSQSELPELETSEPATVPGAFRFYRQEEFHRVLASLLADESLLVAGEQGCGKSVLANAVVEKLREDGFLVAFINEPASPKSMLLSIAKQLGINAVMMEVKAWTIDELKAEISEFFQENVAFLIIDDAHLCDLKFRTWLKYLYQKKGSLLLLAKDPPRTDVLVNLPPFVLRPLPEYAIREIMESTALARGLHLKNSDFAQLQERAGGNPMLAIRTINEEYLGLEVNAADHRRYVDATPLLLVCAIAFMVLRFVGMGTNNHNLYLVSGVGGVILMGISRLLYNLPQESRRIQQ